MTPAPPLPSTVLSGATQPRSAANAVRDLRDGFALYELWLFLGWRDVRKVYSRSTLGPFWLTLSMGVMIGTLGILYSQIFKTDIHTYLPFLAISFVTWNLISGSITGACMVFADAAVAIRQMRMPLSLYLLKFVWTQLIAFFHNFVIYILVALIFTVPLGLSALLALPALALIAINAFFAAMILGVISARFRDVPMMVASVVQITFFLTPIIWHADQLSGRSYLVELNPFYHLIEIIRAPLLGQASDGQSWAIVLALTLVHGGIAFAFFARFRSRIAYWA